MIGWQTEKTGFYLSVIFPQAFSYKQTLLAMWISYFSQDAEQLALFTFYVFTDLDKVSVHKHTKTLSPSKKAWSNPYLILFIFMHLSNKVLLPWHSFVTLTVPTTELFENFFVRKWERKTMAIKKSTIKRKWCVHMIFSLKCLHKCATRVCMQFAFLVQQNVVTL